MSRRYLTANTAAMLLYRASCPDDYVLHEFIEKAETVIQTYATKGCEFAFYRIPMIYSTVPVYNFQSMIQQIRNHFIKQGFYVRHIRNGYMWISWRHAFRKYAKRQTHSRKRKRD